MPDGSSLPSVKSTAVPASFAAPENSVTTPPGDTLSVSPAPSRMGEPSLPSFISTSRSTASGISLAVLDRAEAFSSASFFPNGDSAENAASVCSRASSNIFGPKTLSI
ncbi:hypothetical protein FACS189425_09700 [Clostridia bacterium]|nr:hypothetical protein FACS189425_09700 [Clostridia bacterium]